MSEPSNTQGSDRYVRIAKWLGAKLVDVPGWGSMFVFPIRGPVKDYLIQHGQLEVYLRSPDGCHAIENRLRGLDYEFSSSSYTGIVPNRPRREKFKIHPQWERNLIKQEAEAPTKADALLEAVDQLISQTREERE